MVQSDVIGDAWLIYAYLYSTENSQQQSADLYTAFMTFKTALSRL